MQIESGFQNVSFKYLLFHTETQKTQKKARFIKIRFWLFVPLSNERKSGAEKEEAPKNLLR